MASAERWGLEGMRNDDDSPLLVNSDLVAGRRWWRWRGVVAVVGLGRMDGYMVCYTGMVG